jgi:hypothetical protein
MTPLFTKTLASCPCFIRSSNDKAAMKVVAELMQERNQIYMERGFQQNCFILSRQWEESMRADDFLIQWCPTLSSFSTCGDRRFKSGDK